MRAPVGEGHAGLALSQRLLGIAERPQRPRLKAEEPMAESWPYSMARGRSAARLVRGTLGSQCLRRLVSTPRSNTCFPTTKCASTRRPGRVPFPQCEQSSQASVRSGSPPARLKRPHAVQTRESAALPLPAAGKVRRPPVGGAGLWCCLALASHQHGTQGQTLPAQQFVLVALGVSGSTPQGEPRDGGD